MTGNEKTTNKPTPPKGGRKGGTLFPKIDLKQALEYAKKLVAKTHTGPQPEKTVLPGVFGSAGNPGKVRASALKQFGLMEGEAAAYQATKLARDIDAATLEDQGPLLESAFLNSKLFKTIFETYHGDTVSKAKIKQRAQGLHIHPESADDCVELFIDSAVAAGLGTLDGDSITLVKAGAVTAADVGTPVGEDAAPPEGSGAAQVGDAGATGASAALRNGADHKTEESRRSGNKSRRHGEPQRGFEQRSRQAAEATRTSQDVRCDLTMGRCHGWPIEASYSRSCTQTILSSDGAGAMQDACYPVRRHVNVTGQLRGGDSQGSDGVGQVFPRMDGSSRHGSPQS